MIYQVNPNEVAITDPYPRDVARQKARLETEGMIEPLVATFEHGMWRVDNSDWPYATAQVQAARELDWPTIILTTETN